MKDIITLIILGISFGFTYAIVKVLAGYPDTEMLTIGVSTFVALILIASSKKKSIRMKSLLTKNMLWFCTICGLSSFLIPFTMEFMVLETLDLGLVAIVVSTSPIFGVIFFLVTGKDTVNLKLALSVLIGLLGCALALYSNGILDSLFDGSATIDENVLEYLPMLVAIPISYGFYHYYVDVNWPLGIRPSELAAGELFICSMVCCVLVLWHGIDFDVLDTKWVFLVLMLGCLTSLEAILYFNLQEKKGAVFCSFSEYIATIMGVLLGVILFGEVTSVLVILAVILVITSAWVANSHSHRSGSTEQDELGALDENSKLPNRL